MEITKLMTQMIEIMIGSMETMIKAIESIDRWPMIFILKISGLKKWKKTLVPARKLKYSRMPSVPSRLA